MSRQIFRFRFRNLSEKLSFSVELNAYIALNTSLVNCEQLRQNIDNNEIFFPGIVTKTIKMSFERTFFYLIPVLCSLFSKL